MLRARAHSAPTRFLKYPSSGSPTPSVALVITMDFFPEKSRGRSRSATLTGAPWQLNCVSSRPLRSTQ